jgi:nucleoside phosphorylase
MKLRPNSEAYWEIPHQGRPRPFLIEVTPQFEQKAIITIDLEQDKRWLGRIEKEVIVDDIECKNLVKEVTTPTVNFIQPEPTSPPLAIVPILIVTVTKIEAQSILKAFSAEPQQARQVIGDKIYYALGIHGGAPIYMVQSEMGNATPGGALLTVRQAIQDLHPQVVIMCGIAYGLRPTQQKLGDILIAKQLTYYEPQKVDMRRGQIPRGDRTTTSERLLNRFRSADMDWNGAKLHFGLVLSGEKLVNDPIFRERLIKAEAEALGGEMEGAGLYAAARDAKVDWILVKAICDWGDGNKEDSIQTLAASNAAQFVLHAIKVGKW